MTATFRTIPRWLFALPFVAAISGFRPPLRVNQLRTIDLLPGQTKMRGTPQSFVVKGDGTCGSVDIDWGDGVTESLETASILSYVVDTDASGAQSFHFTVRHTFGWNGGKTVTAIAKAGCVGRASTRFTTIPYEFRLGFARPGPTQCNTIPGQPPVGSNANIYIRTIPVPTQCGGIWYPNRTPHCYDANGIATLAPSVPPLPPGVSLPLLGRFPFPLFREFSLILRVGTQVVQGGTNMSFTTNQSGPLEFCVNEPIPMEGKDGYEIHIIVDESGPPAS